MLHPHRVTSSPANYRYGAYARDDTVECYGFSTDDPLDGVRISHRMVTPEYRRLSASPFRCTLTGVGHRDVHLEMERVEGEVWGEIRIPDDVLVVILPLGLDATRALGAPLREESAYLCTPGLLLAGSSREFTFVTVDFQGEALVRLAAAAGIDLAAPPWLRPAMLPLSGPEGAALTQLLRDLADVLEANPERLADPAVFARAEEDFTSAVQAALASTTPFREHDMTHAARVRLAWRAKDLLVAQARRGGDPLAVQDLCRALDTTERTLRQAFLEEFGVRMSEMGRSFRLQQVHEEIAKGDPADSVTAIALRHGFWHLGRFAGYYREMFGRPPSEVHRIACSQALASHGGPR
jgi:methylphosphotriester-DNA--protein-cysteine methyltransferase